MSFAPIVMFVYNRADHFEKTVTALSKCPEAKQSELFVFSDGAKNSAAVDKVDSVRELAHVIQKQDYFKQVTISESKSNKGLANSVIAGVTEIINQYGKVIVLEDDCVPSPHFLHFMNTCLDAFEDNNHIGAIAGYAPLLEFPEDYTKDLFTAYRSCSCAWATWKDRWQDVDWKLSTIPELYRDSNLINRLNSNGTDRFIRLYRQANGGRDSWSIKFGYHLVRNDWLTVYPRYSYISNIGADNSGVHSKSDDADSLVMDLSKSISDPEVEYVVPDERIQKRMKKFYSSGFWSDVKRFIATKAIIMKERSKS